MPDPTYASVSSSEVPALFDSHQYYTRWMLWHAHRGHDRSAIEPQELSDRVRFGVLLQPVILQMTAEKYRLEVVENKGNEYARRGPLGATIDADLIDPSRGRVIVEAKNIDWLRWKQTWRDGLATPAVEIQTQISMHAAGAEAGIIAALIGGNELKFYERVPNPDIIGPAEERAAQFLADVAAGREPDPTASALQLPLLAEMFPEPDPMEVVEDFDEELAMALRQYKRSEAAAKIEKKTADQCKAFILGRARGAGVLRSNGYTAFIKRSKREEGICEPHTEPKVIRKSSSPVSIDIEQTTRREPAAGEAVNVFSVGGGI